MPLIPPESFENNVLLRNGRLGQDAGEIMTAALNAVDPYDCVQSHLLREGERLEINGESFDLANINRIFLVGIGKASVPMAMAVLDRIGDLVKKAMVITKDAKFLAQAGYQEKPNEGLYDCCCYTSRKRTSVGYIGITLSDCLCRFVSGPISVENLYIPSNQRTPLQEGIFP